MTTSTRAYFDPQPRGPLVRVHVADTSSRPAPVRAGHSASLAPRSTSITACRATIGRLSGQVHRGTDHCGATRRRGNGRPTCPAEVGQSVRFIESRALLADARHFSPREQACLRLPEANRSPLSMFPEGYRLGPYRIANDQTLRLATLERTVRSLLPWPREPEQSSEADPRSPQ